MGLLPVRAGIQIESIDDALRVGLWNALLKHHFTHVVTVPRNTSLVFPRAELKHTCLELWQHYFKWPIDTLPTSWREIVAELRAFFFAAPWNQLYDFVEFIPNHFQDEMENSAFYEEANRVLQREMSAYRFVSGAIVRVTEPQEIESIECAANLVPEFRTVSEHLRSALSHLSDRESPDYRNSIKESISAVEGMCALITGQEKSDLNAALRELERRIRLHGALRSAFASFYGYTSDSDGIRHALLEETNLSFDDAKFMLVACSAFVNYLKALIERARLAP